MWFHAVVYRGLYQIVPDYGSPARSSRLFSEGEHYVEYRAVDAAGKVASCSFTVTVDGQFAHLFTWITCHVTV